MSLTSSQPYLLRAIYEWIVDNELTPYLLVDASNDYVQVPQQYVENGKIVLNIAPRAVNNLELGNDHILFNARFAGRPMEVTLPIASVLAIYAKENGQGMVFNEPGDGGEPPPGSSPTEDKKKPNLKLVK
jgi:stringent starvation protein B